MFKSKISLAIFSRKRNIYYTTALRESAGLRFPGNGTAEPPAQPLGRPRLISRKHCCHHCPSWARTTPEPDARNVPAAASEQVIRRPTSASRALKSASVLQNLGPLKLCLQRCLRNVALVFLTSPGQRDTLNDLGWTRDKPAHSVFHPALPFGNVSLSPRGTQTTWREFQRVHFSVGGISYFLRYLPILGFFDYLWVSFFKRI